MQAATVSHTFVAFGELLQLHKRFLELLGYSSRVLELDSALRATHKMEAKLSASSGLIDLDDDSEDCIRFEDLDIVTPTGNRLVSSLTLKVKPIAVYRYADHHVATPHLVTIAHLFTSGGDGVITKNGVPMDRYVGTVLR